MCCSRVEIINLMVSCISPKLHICTIISALLNHNPHIVFTKFQSLQFLPESKPFLLFAKFNIKQCSPLAHVHLFIETLCDGPHGVYLRPLILICKYLSTIAWSANSSQINCGNYYFPIVQWFQSTVWSFFESNHAHTSTAHTMHTGSARLLNRTQYI